MNWKFKVGDRVFHTAVRGHKGKCSVGTIDKLAMVPYHTPRVAYSIKWDSGAWGTPYEEEYLFLYQEPNDILINLLFF